MPDHQAARDLNLPESFRQGAPLAHAPGPDEDPRAHLLPIPETPPIGPVERVDLAESIRTGELPCDHAYKEPRLSLR